ncbi:MAG: murein biosynthesis integral membrane protein MurJ [Proteobacteria bacterium]|nr:murein biosynthesis integral membrane protein MurJ [Pseudomonadota bacterium]
MSKSLYKKVGLASLIMMMSVFLSRVIGLVREMVISYVAGAGEAVDAYQIAFVIPEILNHVLASGFLSITFIPIFSKYLAKNQEEEGWRVFSVVLTCFGSLLILLAIVFMIFAPWLIGLAGFENPSTMASAVRMTRIIIPAQIFFFVGGLLMAVQFAKERFAVPALAPLIYNLGIICGGVLLSPWLGMEGFSWGVLAGAFLGNFVVQLFGARKAGLKFRLLFDVKHPDLRRYILLTLPLMVGLTMTFSTEVFSKFFGSYLPEGSVSSLNYSLRIMFVLVGIFGQAAGVASYPFLARLVAENKIEEMNDLLNNTLRFISLVIPFSVLAMVLRHEVVLMLFQRGSFDPKATALTSNVLVFVLLGTVAFAAQTLVTRGYYAMQNTLFPTIFGSIAVLASIPLYLIAMDRMGVTGVALALSLSAMLQVSLLYVLWNRKSGNKGGRTVYLFFVKIVVVSVMLGAFLELFKTGVLGSIDTSTFVGSLVVSAIIGSLFMVLFVVAGYCFGIKEINELIRRLAARIKKSKRNDVK